MRGARILTWSVPALALLLWFGATLFYLGDTGRYSDDHAAHMRSPITSAIDWSRHPWQRWDYFWRPIHLAHCTIVNTLSWNHAWIGHFELALIHAGVGWLLRLLLIRLGVRSPVASGAALLFVLCPFTAEAALWTSASCNAISSLLLLLTLELVRRHAAAPHDRFRVAIIGLMGFIIPCWYEPAAAGLAVLPLVYLAACPASGSWPVRLRHMAAPTLLCALGCAVYVALLIATAPVQARGSLPSLAAPRELPQRIFTLGDMACDLAGGSRGHEILLGSIEQGIQALHSTSGLLWLTALAILASIAGVAWIADSIRVRPTTTHASPRRGTILLIGATISIASCLPVLISDAPSIDLRTLYVPLLGLTIFLAGLANGGAAIAERRAAFTRGAIRIGAGLATGAAALLGAIGMIGFQTQFRTIDRNDQRITSQLRAAFPNPVSGTTFLPLIISCRGGTTGYSLYDHALHSGLELPSCATTMLRFALGRADVSCVGLSFRLEGRVPISDLGAEGFRINRTRAGALAPGFVPWDKAIPFVVDESGAVTFVDHLVVRGRSGILHDIHPSQTHPLNPTPSQRSIELIENPDGRTSVRIVDIPSLDIPGQ